MRILLVEDDLRLCELVEDSLRQEGYLVDICHEGDDGLHWMQQRAHDLVILDRMLPRLDGLTLLGMARKQQINTPVLMVTALGEIQDRVDGLELGADDYLVKPFSTKELIARIHAIVRRPKEWTGQTALSFSDLRFEPTQQLLSKGEAVLFLSRREAALLEFFLKNPEKTLPRSALLSYVWGPDAPVEGGNLDSYIHFLRRHLKELNSRCAIVTVRNVGYRLQQDREA